MGIEGALQIRRTASKVVIHSSRPLHASRLFRGKSVEETVEGLPLLYSLCGTAQRCAAVRACEQALQIETDLQIEGVRDALVQMETLREHLWRTLLDWPQFFSLSDPLQREMAEIVQLQQQFVRMLTTDGNPFLLHPQSNSTTIEPQPLLNEMHSLVEQTLFGINLEQWLNLETIDQLLLWAEQSQSIAAAAIRHITALRWEDVGHCRIKSLPPLEPNLLQQQMNNEGFIERPQWKGHCYETSSLTRNSDTPLQRVLEQQFGNGMLTRICARLTEIARLVTTLQPYSVNLERGCELGKGISQVEAARGQLIHSVIVDRGKIEQYCILAPTEWNFHPQGVVAESLRGLQGEREAVERQAKLLITSIDPCVGYELEIVDA